MSVLNLDKFLEAISRYESIVTQTPFANQLDTISLDSLKNLYMRVYEELVHSDEKFISIDRKDYYVIIYFSNLRTGQLIARMQDQENNGNISAITDELYKLSKYTLEFIREVDNINNGIVIWRSTIIPLLIAALDYICTFNSIQKDTLLLDKDKKDEGDYLRILHILEKRIPSSDMLKNFPLIKEECEAIRFFFDKYKPDYADNKQVLMGLESVVNVIEERKEASATTLKLLLPYLMPIYNNL